MVGPIARRATASPCLYAGERSVGQTEAVSIASAVAVALPATGPVVAVVLASWRLTWRGLSNRMDGQERRLDEHGNRPDNLGRRLDAIGSQQGQILRALGRIEGRLGIADDPAEVA